MNTLSAEQQTAPAIMSALQKKSTCPKKFAEGKLMGKKKEKLEKGSGQNLGIFARRTKELREKLGMSKRDLVAAVNNAAAIALALNPGGPAGIIDNSAISRIESGSTRTINSETLANLAAALRTNPLYLLGRTDESGTQDTHFNDVLLKKLVELYSQMTYEQAKGLLSYATFLIQQKEES